MSLLALLLSAIALLSRAPDSGTNRRNAPFFERINIEKFPVHGFSLLTPRPRDFATLLLYLAAICGMTSAIVTIFATGRKPSMAAR
jgi:hypothetical protein